MSRFHALLVAMVGLPFEAALADDPWTPVEVSARTPLMLDSGWVAAPPGSRRPEVIAELLVHVPGAPWVRLEFADAGVTRLAGDPAADNAARLRITSLADGASQLLNAETLAQWGNTSAYFNGDAVLVELLAADGPGPSRVVVHSALAGPARPVTDRSICQRIDDRTLSDDPRAGRLLSVGCTAWLINDLNSTFMSAGHCSVAPTSVVQFNVPLSTSNGTSQHPPPEDQYAVDVSSSQGNSGGVGDDWRYFACFANSNTGLTPYQRQQARHALAPGAPPTSERTIRITGYGTTSSPVSPTLSKVQKTHAGPYISLNASTVRYHVDTTGGNSGSAVVDETTGLAIGIHTHGGCGTSTTSSNAGTALQHSGLRAALAAPRGLCASGGSRATGWIYAAGDLNNSIGTVSHVSGGFRKIGEADAPMQGLAHDPLTGVLWCIDSARRLRAIDPATGAVGESVLLSGAPGAVNGLAFDPSGPTLYGISQADGQLFTISTNSGEASPIGAPAGGNVGALDFDADHGVLCGIDDAPAGSRLVRISTSSGEHQVVGPLGAGILDCNGLAWAPADGRLYTINAATGQLLRINPATGEAAVVGPTDGMFGSGFGLAAVPARLYPCRSDTNRDGTTTVQDLLDYAVLWFARDPGAEFDRLPGVDTGDIVGFVSEWLAGCD
ncbi:MAG: DUF6923 family protein [Phycisphaerales bacterium]